MGMALGRVMAILTAHRPGHSSPTVNTQTFHPVPLSGSWVCPPSAGLGSVGECQGDMQWVGHGGKERGS